MSEIFSDTVDPMTVAAQEAADVLKALSNPARLRILCALVPEDRSVSELVALLDARQAYVSGQLLRLRSEGLVSCSKSGRTVRYRLSDPRVRPILERLYDVFCAEN